MYFRVYANAGVDAIIVDNLTANTEYEIQVWYEYYNCSHICLQLFLLYFDFF